MVRKRVLYFFCVLNIIVGPSMLAVNIYSLITTSHDLTSYPTQDDLNLSVTVNTVITTSLPIQDIEVGEKKLSTDYMDIYVCEGRFVTWENRSGKIGYARKGATWTYEYIFSDPDKCFAQLAIRNASGTLGTVELAVGHWKGLTLLTKELQEHDWTNSTLYQLEYWHPWELLAADLDPTAAGKEILLIYESVVMDCAGFFLFSYNDLWTSQFIYGENPVTRAACVGEFNSSHPGTELISVNEGGYVTLLEWEDGSWRGNRLWDDDRYFFLTAVTAADLYLDITGDEFIVGASNYTELGPDSYKENFLVIFSRKNDSWEPEIVPLGVHDSDVSNMITDLTTANVTHSQHKDIIAVDSNGTVWLVYPTENSWDTVKLWQDTGALYAVRALPNSNSIIVGGKSAKLTEITINTMPSNASSTVTTTVPSTTTTTTTNTTTTITTTTTSSSTSASTTWLSSTDTTSHIRTTGIVLSEVFLFLVAVTFFSFKRKKGHS